MNINPSGWPISLKIPTMIIVAGIIAVSITGLSSYFNGKKTVFLGAEAVLTAVVDDRLYGLSDWLESIESDLVMLAKSPLLDDALEAFTSGWQEIGSDQKTILQSHYLVKESDSLSEKESPDIVSDSLGYDLAHEKHHSHLRDFFHGREYYDIFLFDKSGNLIYTILKEPDFATNVISGEWADSSAGDAFRAARDNPKEGRISFSDFEAYAPNNGAPASFISTPLLDEQGHLQGVLAFKISIAKLDAIMQQRSGLGQSGETYLVGSDHLMRSGSRFGTDFTILETKVETEQVQHALNGGSGLMFGLDYRQVPVVAAYRPITHLGVTWAIIAEIDYAEVYASVVSLRRDIILYSMFGIVFVAGFGFFVGKNISRSISEITNAMVQLAQGDKSTSIPGKMRQDEIGSIATAVQVFKDNAIRNKVHDAADIRSIITMTDAQGIVTFVNDNFVRISGYSREEIVGKTHAVVKSDAHPAKFYEKLWGEIANGHSWHGVIQNKNRNGESYWVDTSIVPDKDAEGVITGYTSVRTDISAIVKAKNQARDAKAANQAKSEFLSMMSHELRTPMNAILGSAQLLKTTDLSEEQDEHVKTMLDGGEILITVLNDVLDFSKIEAGKLDINPIDINVVDLVQQLDRLWRHEAEEAGLELVCSTHEDVPAFINIDGTRLRQILYNLISNAIKFTEKGKVGLTVSLVNQEDGVARLQFEISDTGVGISEEAQSRLFKAFEQADGSTTRRFGGTGLGLAISRKLARLMGGDIHVKSVEGEGTSFLIELDAPVVAKFETPSEEDEDATSEATEAPDRRLSLLAAEDNAHNRRILAAFLKSLNADLTFAVDGEEALQMLMAQPFDVVLMDIQMPKMDGVDVVKAIRAQEGPNQDAPVIAVTANAVQGAEESYLAAGMDGYISKPIDPRQLHVAIATASELKRHTPVDASAKTA